MTETFSLLTVDTYLNKKQIILTFTKSLDKNSLNNIITELYIRSSKVPVTFSTDINNTKFIITFNKWPEPNMDYILSVKNIVSIDDESLPSDIKRKVIFKSEVTNTVKILSPIMFEKVNELILKLEPTNTLLEDEEFYIEVSKDNAFIDVPIKTKSKEQEITLKLNEDNNYFIRARINNKNEYGLFSDTISFYYEKVLKKDDDTDTSSPDIDDDKPVIDLIPFIVNYKINEGETPKEIILEFNNDIDITSLTNIKITRQVIK